MTVRNLLLAALAALAAGCAQQETTAQCSASECSATCPSGSGSCVDERCVCRSLDGGDGDAPVDAEAETGADADAPDVPREDGPAEDAGVEDRGVEDAPAEEAGGPEVGDPCSVADLVDQRLCGTGMKCAFAALVGTSPDAICDVAGARDVNVACTGSSSTDNCQAGLMCLNDGSGSRCRRLCRTDADCRVLGPRAGCQIQISFDGTVVVGVQACTYDCDVLAGTGCVTGQACRAQFVDSGGGVYTAYSDCTGIGAGTQGADCSARGPADCALRYGCFNITGGVPPTQCLYFCDMFLGGGDCPAGVVMCNPINDPAARIGACL